MALGNILAQSLGQLGVPGAADSSPASFQQFIEALLSGSGQGAGRHDTNPNIPTSTIGQSSDLPTDLGFPMNMVMDRVNNPSQNDIYQYHMQNMEKLAPKYENQMGLDVLKNTYKDVEKRHQEITKQMEKLGVPPAFRPKQPSLIEILLSVLGLSAGGQTGARMVGAFHQLREQEQKDEYGSQVQNWQSRQELLSKLLGATETDMRNVRGEMSDVQQKAATLAGRDAQAVTGSWMDTLDRNERARAAEAAAKSRERIAAGRITSGITQVRKDLDKFTSPDQYADEIRRALEEQADSLDAGGNTEAADRVRARIPVEVDAAKKNFRITPAAQKDLSTMKFLNIRADQLPLTENARRELWSATGDYKREMTRVSQLTGVEKARASIAALKASAVALGSLVGLRNAQISEIMEGMKYMHLDAARAGLYFANTVKDLEKALTTMVDTGEVDEDGYVIKKPLAIAFPQAAQNLNMALDAARLAMGWRKKKVSKPVTIGGVTINMETEEWVAPESGLLVPPPVDTGGKNGAGGSPGGKKIVGGKKKMTPEIADRYMRMAGDDIDKAMEMARKDGYDL